MDWGNVPAWVGSSLSGMALLVTAISLRNERLRTATDRRAREDAERRQQATLVTTWTDRMGVPNEEEQDYFAQTDGGLPEAIGWTVTIRINNGSQAPVTELLWSVSSGVRGTAVGHVDVLPPEHLLELVIPFPAFPHSMPSPEISFTDAAGHAWNRNARGLLEFGGKQFQQDSGAYPNAASHPTLGISAYRRLLGRQVHPQSGRIVLKDREI